MNIIIDEGAHLGQLSLDGGGDGGQRLCGVVKLVEALQRNQLAGSLHTWSAKAWEAINYEYAINE